MTDWSFRLGVAALAVLLGGVSVAHSIANTLLLEEPEAAHALAPWDARIEAMLAATWVVDQDNPVHTTAARRLAREALLKDATSLQAVTTLAFLAELSGDNSGARGLFDYAQSLSRRDVTHQLWAIEDAVARQDIAGALVHYDIALRIHPLTPNLLFPVLAEAIAEPAVREQLVRTLGANPPWRGSWIDYVAANGPAPQATAMLFREMAAANILPSFNAQAALVAALIGTGSIEQAWTYYASTHAGADRRRSRDPRFTRDVVSPTLFDWVTVNETGATAIIQHDAAGGFVEYSAPPILGGVLLRQLQVLPPGSYVLTGRSAGADELESIRPYWVVACLDGRELGRVVLPRSAVHLERFEGRIKVPTGCAAQYLSLVVPSSDALAGVSGRIEEAQLRPEV